MTTIIVTHDQEEAMEVAEQIALLHEGRIEQVGSPRDLYERPANEFVMGFVGPVQPARGDALVRPRDVAVRAEPGEVTRRWWARRASRLRGARRARAPRRPEHLWAQLTSDEAELLELERGRIVYVQTSRERVFS